MHTEQDKETINTYIDKMQNIFWGWVIKKVVQKILVRLDVSACSANISYICLKIEIYVCWV